jgi:hypothetical protein
MDDVCRFVLLEDCLGLCQLSFIVNISASCQQELDDRAAFHNSDKMSAADTHLRSPSLLDRNIHCSSSLCLPYLLPTGSVSITCCRARPTRPVPPVTRQTVRPAAGWPSSFQCVLSPFAWASVMLGCADSSAQAGEANQR